MQQYCNGSVFPLRARFFVLISLSGLFGGPDKGIESTEQLQPTQTVRFASDGPGCRLGCFQLTEK